jgi:ribosomal protein L12E/L44/L45/RPP1/RPP2
MKYLAAYALAWLAGNENPSPKQLQQIIEAGGGEFDQG